MQPLVLLGLALALPLAQPEGGVISLGVGQQKVIQLGSVARVAIGEPEIADVKQVGSRGELLLTRATGEKAENLVTVAVRKMVLVEVDFVEVSSGSSKVVGIKPPSSLVSTGDGVTASINIVQPLRGLDSGQTQKSGSLTVNAA